MLINIFKNTVLLFVLIHLSCGSNVDREVINLEKISSQIEQEPSIVIGANLTSSYLDALKGKKIGIVANQTSVIFKNDGKSYVHLVDSLLSLGVNIKKVFAPEHGFRGTADAGELVHDGVDIKTGLPIISLYGKNKKPGPEQLEGIDMIIFDIQDVGARFYTYISSLHYVMEACSEQDIPLLVLDRPNPNGHYIDGPMLEKEHQSFVGMHPVPVVHGMTIGEYAQMINGERWLEKGIQCDLSIIKMKNYSHSTSYDLPIKPSPNLPNAKAINLYPSLCFFEGTNVSAGRGTEMQFQIYGSPYLDPKYNTFEFTPVANEGAKYPKHQNILCKGMDLRNYENLSYLNLEWLIEAYNSTSDKSEFFNSFFTKLAGTKKLQEQIEKGFTAYEIRKSWMPDLEAYKRLSKQYNLYD